jgi:hypothetical protein
MRQIKTEIETAIQAVRTGELDRSVGAVIFQGCNVLMRAVEIEREVREIDELEERTLGLEQPCRAWETRPGRSTCGALREAAAEAGGPGGGPGNFAGEA